MTTFADTSDKKRPSSPALDATNKKSRKIDDADQEFDDLEMTGGVDDEALIAAVEAAESTASVAATSPSSSAPSSSNPQPQLNSSTLGLSTSKPSNGSHSMKSSEVKDTQTSTTSIPNFEPPKEPMSDLLSLERQTMAPDWFQRLEKEMTKSYFVELKKFLTNENVAGRVTYPPPQLVHSWSRLTPIEQIKVVVVGQDPYHGDGQACGLSFSVPKGVAIPPSLKNIYKELATEYPGTFKAPSHGCLDEWAKQGVLMLNACLTVSAKQAGSHHGKGWEKLTKHILKLIADQAASSAGTASKKATANSQIANMFAKVSAKQGHTEPQDKQSKELSSNSNADGDKTNNGLCKGVVFLAWGAPAAKTLAEAGVTKESPNVLILRSPHPSPLSAHRGFLGNGHFLAANRWLEQQYGTDGGIDWSKL